MKKKTLIIVIVSLLIIIIISIFMTYSRLPYQKGTEPKGLIWIDLRKIPAGTPAESDIEGIATTTFRNGDLIGMVGIANISKEGKLSFKVLTEDGKLSQEFFFGSGKINPYTGRMRFCCIHPPPEIGKHELQVYFNEKKAYSVPFEVVK